MDAADRELGHTFGPVLMRMVELLGDRPKGLTFGSALAQACTELDLHPPRPVQVALLSAAFKIMTRGKLPGCPDA